MKFYGIIMFIFIVYLQCHYLYCETVLDGPIVVFSKYEKISETATLARPVTIKRGEKMFIFYNDDNLVREIKSEMDSQIDFIHNE